MSKIKTFYQDFFQEENFVTDDSYADYLRMKENHEQQQMLEELNEQHEGAKMNRSFNRTNPNDLPF
jgi:hypothetical protein